MSSVDTCSLSKSWNLFFVFQPRPLTPFAPSPPPPALPAAVDVETFSPWCVGMLSFISWWIRPVGPACLVGRSRNQRWSRCQRFIQPNPVSPTSSWGGSCDFKTVCVGYCANQSGSASEKYVHLHRVRQEYWVRTRLRRCNWHPRRFSRLTDSTLYSTVRYRKCFEALGSQAEPHIPEVSVSFFPPPPFSVTITLFWTISTFHSVGVEKSCLDAPPPPPLLLPRRNCFHALTFLKLKNKTKMIFLPDALFSFSSEQNKAIILSFLRKKNPDPRPLPCSSECGTEAVCISGSLPIILFLLTSILLQIKKEKKIHKKTFFFLFASVTVLLLSAHVVVKV